MATDDSWVIFYTSNARTVCKDEGREGPEADLSSREPQEVIRLLHVAVELLRP